LTLTGTGFTAQSVVELGGAALATLYWNPTALTATGHAIARSSDRPIQNPTAGFS
jgi:hypothetical protein